MAREAEKIIRFSERIGTLVRKSASFVAGVIKALLNVQSGDGLATEGKKVVVFAVRRGVYFAADNYLVVLSAAIVAGMKYNNFSFETTFLAMWLFDVIVASAFLAFYAKTGTDLSLGEDLRRATDKVAEASRVAGYLATAGVIFWAIFWTGPEKIVIYFRKEIKTNFRSAIVLLVLTSIQAIIWVNIYGFGYDALTR